ncbi:response regulator [Halorientalis regularis]|uniref:HalX domain-containing protein n=1 Tax=Halorientalis regularis TaxID=660518 RepID=A0A1G7HUL9_9EURY|nr:response regulator [Halorientalis regularis]SDF04008.1 HalX domain-containing protein [Halorientalis regularis]
MGNDSAAATVLVVDDETEVADVYALKIEREYDVRVAYGGQEALEKADGVDVVLLDRRMPDVSGDEVLAELRDREDDYRVIMITAVDPDFDIIEMPFDDYLCKPVESADLLGAVEQQLAADAYDDRLTEYYEVTSKLALLEAEKTPQELDENEDVAALRERADRLESEMAESLSDFEDFELAFRDIGRQPGG